MSIDFHDHEAIMAEVERLQEAQVDPTEIEAFAKKMLKARMEWEINPHLVAPREIIYHQYETSKIGMWVLGFIEGQTAQIKKERRERREG